MLRAVGEFQLDQHLMLSKVPFKRGRSPPEQENNVRTVVMFESLMDNGYGDDFRKR